MEENQLKILEDRINNAISFIGRLKDRERTLVSEKGQVEQRVKELETLLEEKDLKIEALRENQLFLKNKIETILDKLEGLASVDPASGQNNEEDGAFHQESKEAGPIHEESGEKLPHTAVHSFTGPNQTESGKNVSFDEDNPSGNESGSEDFSVQPDQDSGRNDQNDQDEESGIIVEENLVDLKEDESYGSQDTVPDKGPAPDSDDTERKEEQHGKDGNNLFDNPFIQM
jgi:hypothetical protein